MTPNMQTIKLTDTTTTRWVPCREPAYKGREIYAYLEMFVGPEGKLYTVPGVSRMVYVTDAA